MSKIKVETVGDFMLLDLTNGQEIQAFGETEVEPTAFIASEIVRGRLKQTSGADIDLTNTNPGSDPVPIKDVDTIPEPMRTDDKAVVSNASGELEPTDAEKAEDDASINGGRRKAK